MSALRKDLRQLKARFGLQLFALAAVLCTCWVVTDHAAAVYILPGEGEPAVAVNEEAADGHLSARLVHLSGSEDGYDTRLAAGQTVTVTHGGDTVTAEARNETVASLLDRLHITPSPLEMVAVDADADGVPAEYTEYLNGTLTGVVTGGSVNELVETDDGDTEDEDPDDGDDNKINPQVWLIVSSVVIGVIIIAVVIVLTYRKIKGKVQKKLKKVKGESKVPTDLEERVKKNDLNRKAENKKKDINADEYKD